MHTPDYLHDDEGRDIAEEAKEVDDPSHAPATGRGGVIDTNQKPDAEEPDTFDPDE